jgi:phenylacetate-CoA ligase
VIGAGDVARAAWHAFRYRRATRDRITALRDARLRRLVVHAHARVPYYRALFDRHGIDPGRIRTAADLTNVPVSSRRDFQTAPVTALVAQGVDPTRLIVHSTSGSTGQPLRVRRTWLEERLTAIFHLRALRDLGLRARDVRVRLILDRGHDPHNWEGVQRLIKALGVHRKISVDRQLPAADLIRRLEAIRPATISSTPGTLVRLGQAVAAARPTSFRPRMILCGGDVLTPLLRRRITDSFGVRVFDTYGSWELGVFAWECPRVGGFHVADDAVVIEVIKDGRAASPGETGEVVATQLHAFAAPFIRYRLGDLATRGETPCPCGAPFSTLVDVQGRVQDYFPLANGRLFSPTELLPLMLAAPTQWVAQHQAIQERTDRVVLRIVPLTSPTSEMVASLERAGRETLGAGIEFHVELVPEIPLDENGKFQVSRSLVQSFYRPPETTTTAPVRPA